MHSLRSALQIHPPLSLRSHKNGRQAAIPKTMMAQQKDGERMSVTILPTFKGYTVDMRLREFRKAVHCEPLEFFPFDSPEGQKLLCELLSFAFEIVEAAKEVLDTSQEQLSGSEKGSKAYSDTKKIDLFYLFGSLDKVLLKYRVHGKPMELVKVVVFQILCAWLKKASWHIGC